MRIVQSLCITTTLAVAGLVATAILPARLSALSTADAAQRSAASYICMTDDGYGRKRPCSAGYKASNPNWRATDDCFTDDGYGRRRPCSAGYKASQQK